MSMLFIQSNNVSSTGSINTDSSQTGVVAATLAQPTTIQPQQPIFVRSIVSQSNDQFPQQLLSIRKKLSSVTSPHSTQVQPNLLVPTTNAKIMPFITEVPIIGNEKVAYINPVIKPKSHETTILPKNNGSIGAAQSLKQKVMIAPLYSHSTPGSTSNNLQNQPSKHMTNLILPVSISQLNAPASSKQNISFKSSNFTVKFNNGQINNDQKIPMTVLCETKTSNGSTYLPPLHPIANMNFENASQSSNLSDGVKINENPDSAVITPIPKVQDVFENRLEKRKRPISNIIRSEKRMRKQSFTKTNKDPNLFEESCERIILNSSEMPENEKDKKKDKESDDDITLIEICKPPNKFPMSDEAKIEVVRNLNRNGVEVIEKSDKPYGKTVDNIKDHSKFESDNQETTKILEWKDNIGTIIGTSLKFKLNEFGYLVPLQVDNTGNKDKENLYLSQISCEIVNPGLDKNEDKKPLNLMQDDGTLCDCEVCGLHGTLSEFYNKFVCSYECFEKYDAKQKLRKESKQDTQIKKKRKKLLKPPLKDETKSTESLLNCEKLDGNNDKTDKNSFKIKTSSDEDTKESSIMDEEFHDDTFGKFSWSNGKNKFPWSKYLEHTKAQAAPEKLFKNAFPEGKNNFKVGMKLEGIDPNHPRYYCVLTVAEVIGYRLRLHFDGYPENYDFWVNADSLDIFPVGWVEKNNRKLEPPLGYVQSSFNWSTYLKTCKAHAAPKNLFNDNSMTPTGFRVGMKLEAEDRKHSSQMCVASVADVLDTRILVHFDSWDDIYDYWADISSPYIHPIGWSSRNGRSLTPPNNVEDGEVFVWNDYLEKEDAVAVPNRAFKQRPPCGFKRGMKLEAVDKRLPQLIRVATVEDVNNHFIKIRFDGWPENHAYWIDDDSPDIHPVGWCAKTGHPLEPPITQDNIANRPECGTIGCKGIGHVKGPKFATHNSASGCPYSPQNIDKYKITKDRLALKGDKNGTEDVTVSEKRLPSFENKLLKQDQIKEKEFIIEKSERTEITDRISIKWQKCSDEQSEDEENSRKRKKIKSKACSNRVSIMNKKHDVFNPLHNSNIPEKQLRMELHESIYNPGYNPIPLFTTSDTVWAKYSNILNKAVQVSQSNPLRWCTDEVVKFVSTIPNCQDVAHEFKIHKIDGDAFLAMCQDDLVEHVQLKLGHAIKIYNSIVHLRSIAMSMSK